jgi:hypothetical protein
LVTNHPLLNFRRGWLQFTLYTPQYNTLTIEGPYIKSEQRRIAVDAE